MKLQNALIFLVLLFSNAVSAQTTDLQLEREIYRQLLPALADSLFLDFRKSPPPPPPPPLSYESRGDSIAAHREARALWEEYEARLEEVKADTTTIVLAVNDSTFTNFDEADLQKFRAHFDLSPDPQMDPDTLAEKRIDLERTIPQQKFAFKYRSEFPEGREIWVKEYDFLFSGLLSFSRILFDHSRSYGVLTGGYSCGRLCGHCVRIYIKRVDGSWAIEEIEVTCIS